MPITFLTMFMISVILWLTKVYSPQDFLAIGDLKLFSLITLSIQNIKNTMKKQK